MNVFDESIISFLNEFSNRYIIFDFFINYLKGNMLWKGGVLMALYWMAWFKKTERRESQVHVITSLFSCFAALFVARGLALTLPFRLRPIHNPDIDFLLPYSLNPEILDGWSSFPSDHATLFFAMATGLYFISKKLGVITYIYVFFVICFPRIYLGLHYPTDILGGALVGITITWIFNSLNMRYSLAEPALNLEKTSPKVFYPAFFLLTYELANMFIHLRGFGGDVSDLLEKLT